MSFLNPVNEPVKRFSSTDAGAPQINYNARTAGDVKTVLKACLVTGYGSVASAGWSVVNEVDHVAEFVSPSAAMSDYRFGVDDTSTSSTTWYYQYQNTYINPTYNTPAKSINYINRTHEANGWQLLATSRGIIFIELVYSSVVKDVVSRITYMGAVKSALVSDAGKNFSFYNVGIEGAIYYYSYLYGSHPYVVIGNQTSSGLSDAGSFNNNNNELGISVLDLISRFYIRSATALIGQIPAIYSKVTNNKPDLFGVTDVIIDGKNVLKIPIGYQHPDPQTAYAGIRVVLIDLDSWEY